MKRKLSLLFLLIIFVGVLTTAMLMTNLLNKDHLNSAHEKMLTSGNIIKESILRSGDIRSAELGDFIEKVSDINNFRTTIVSKEGSVILDTMLPLNKLGNHSDRPEIIDAFQGKIGASIRYSVSEKTNVYYLAIPVESGGATFALRLSIPMHDLEEFKFQILYQVLISMLAGLIIAELIGFSFINSFLKPITELTSVSKKIAGGNFRERINIHTDDELGELAQNFNHMSGELERKINEIKERNYEMHSIIKSMINGVIAVDNKKHIMFVNPAAERLFGFKEQDSTDRHILEMLRNSELDDALENLLNDNNSDMVEIEIYEPENKILKIYTNPLIGFNERLGILIVIEDVTEIKRAEAMRKEFVANVSHELKTPLTSIKGFVETLKDGAVENEKVRVRFLDIIDMEADRLKTLIEDILVLSEIESRKNILVEEIPVMKTMGEVMDVMQGIAGQFDVQLSLVSDQESFPSIQGNPFWFKQMLINLIDNGIKYRKERGAVTVKLSALPQHLLIRVEDNGIGIPNEHIGRLFERFYRVDKSRSKNIGGTGLGLAIVKHVVMSFDGEITVESEVGKGTTFTVRLPWETDKQ